jgi:polyferredoxin
MTQLHEVQWLEAITDEQPYHRGDRKSQPLRLNLYRIPWIRSYLENRWPQFLLRALILIGFIFTILTAFIGSPVGSHNFAIIIVWIAWWTLFKLGFIPLGGRSWCSICPVALPGEWLQQGGILQKGKHRLGINLRWPKPLRSSWFQSAGFLLIGTFSAVTLTEPRVTGWVLLALFGLAIGMSLIFEKRAFCSYICPIGGFSGMYAKVAPVEVRVIEREVCARHEDKSCYQACPWGLYPLALKDSSACGVCLECLRACPKDNLALNLRIQGSDLRKQQNSSRLDETFLALIMLGSVLAFSAVFLGPWGWLKSAALEIGSQAWFAYTAAFLTLNLLLLPGLFTLCIWMWKKINHSITPLKNMMVNQAQGLLPLGLMAWIAFTISFALPKLKLVLSVLIDPFGWGWNFFHITNPGKLMDVSGFSPYILLIFLAIGVFWSAGVTHKLSDTEGNIKHQHNLPVYAFYLVFTWFMLWLLVG